MTDTGNKYTRVFLRLLSQTGWCDDEIFAAKLAVKDGEREREGVKKKRRARHMEIINSGCIWLFGSLFDCAWLWFTAIFIFIQISFHLSLSLSFTHGGSCVWLCKTPFTIPSRGRLINIQLCAGQSNIRDRFRKRAALSLSLSHCSCLSFSFSRYLCVLF